MDTQVRMQVRNGVIGELLWDLPDSLKDIIKQRQRRLEEKSSLVKNSLNELMKSVESTEHTLLGNICEVFLKTLVKARVEDGDRDPADETSRTGILIKSLMHIEKEQSQCASTSQTTKGNDSQKA
ncbi:hypothetical protein COB55_02850 [Candidatus Wolfebacteria bacterium]|nr:MAG: hypothetical protein COB55_02850 [Candidatus Wolfebacteria bacterium]